MGSRPVRQCACRIVMEDDLHPDVGAGDGATSVVKNADCDRVSGLGGFLDRGSQSEERQGQPHCEDGHQAGRVSQAIPEEGLQDTLNQSKRG